MGCGKNILSMNELHTHIKYFIEYDLLTEQKRSLRADQMTNEMWGCLVGQGKKGGAGLRILAMCTVSGRVCIFTTFMIFFQSVEYVFPKLRMMLCYYCYYLSAKTFTGPFTSQKTCTEKKFFNLVIN